MSSQSTTAVAPDLPIAVIIGASGAAKLAGASFTVKNFERWGYGQRIRKVIGALEVATAAAALLGRHNAEVRRAATIATLSTMGGAIATHTIHHESKLNLVPPFLLSALAVAASYDRDVIISR